jgi:hypothetical protein
MSLLRGTQVSIPALVSSLGTLEVRKGEEKKKQRKKFMT